MRTVSYTHLDVYKRQAFTQLVNALQITIADTTTTPEQIRAAAAAVQSMANQIVADYPLSTATPTPTATATPTGAVDGD